MEDIKISAEEIKQINNREIESYDDLKEFSSTSFWHYSKFDTIDKILDSKCFWAGRLDKMNDINETDLHKSDDAGKRKYILCFCNSNSEKIPMWYLYGGIQGNGASIGFTPAKMRDFIESINEVKAVYDNDKGKKTLIRGNDFKIAYGWIFYRKTGEKNKINYKNDWYAISDPYNIEKDNYFIKDYPWNYEKEFRIIIDIDSKEECEHVEIAIPDSIYKFLKIKLGPECDSDTDIFKYKGYSKWAKAQVLSSELGINMNLLNKNREEVINNMDIIFDGENYSKACKYMRDNKYCKNNEGGND